MSSFWVGIDLGTTYTAAAVCWPAVDGLEVQVVPLSSHSHAIPSVLFLPGDGSLVVGEGAQRRALTDPDRVIREFKSRVGDEIPVLVGGSAYFAHDLAAEFVVWLWRYVADREGEWPDAVALTCPASWGPYKTGLFQRAVRDAGVPNVVVLSEPQAAAISYASRERVEVGATLAVYDLGGGTFDAAVVRKDSATSFTVLGQPEGVPSVGGLGFDEVIFDHVCAVAGVELDELDPHDPDTAAEVARLRRDCTEAKEALSADTDVTIAVALGGIRQRVRMTRAEFEEMIRPDLDRTIDALRRALAAAAVEAADLDAILLIGGSSRIPLVSQLVASEFGRAPAIDTDPKVAVALGAARYPAPASTPVRDTVEIAIPAPRDLAPPERPQIPSMLARADHAEGPGAPPGPSGRPMSGKAIAGIAAAVVLVLAAGVAALRTPALAGLFSHHSLGRGSTASPQVATTKAASPTPSPHQAATPVRTTKTVPRRGTTSSSASRTAVSTAKASGKNAVTAKTSHGSSTKAAVAPSSAPAISPSSVQSTRPRVRRTHPVVTTTLGTPPVDTSTATPTPDAGASG
jgi:molecular chaperone DnaK